MSRPIQRVVPRTTRPARVLDCYRGRMGGHADSMITDVASSNDTISHEHGAVLRACGRA